METKTYTIDGRTYSVRCGSDRLQHHGVKGMKWGRRKARPQATGTGRRSDQTTADSPEAQAAAKAARKQKLKRAAKIGAAVVGTALAAYGAKKLHDVVRDKNYNYRMNQATKLIDKLCKDGLYQTYPGMNVYDRMHVEDNRGDMMRNVYDTYSKQADRDSFGRAAKNVLGTYLLDETRDKRRRR